MAKKKKLQDVAATGMVTRRHQAIPGDYHADVEFFAFPPEMTDEERQKARERSELKNLNLFQFSNFRVKSVEQFDRESFWEYEIVLTTYNSEVIFRHVELKQTHQPNLPRIGDKFLLRLLSQDPHLQVGCAISDDAQQMPKLTPYRRTE